ncbi:LuxR family transcriptional regulator [Mycolicibacterium agri]|uniref:Transcriptional regulator n=1 Tax=Mycolicibacterium agri TaxID=36811 RepID=A0A2A7MTL4_MYCAG|nr:LuxR family transcriptional regulator [Mycolicibacterium agri]PEG35014.1 LuxR family transcriptional regulator [Mycolicibacterium agri]GFG54094.1 transcriptional regulator [Mycolicibacterium agri]
MSSDGRGDRLRGRADECAALRSLLSTVQSGSCQVLVLRGEAGVGKTALLDFLADSASGFRCIHVAGVESDMELAFAGLQQLCAPLLNHLDELPEPQREALNVAFGRGVGETPDRFLVGLAVLSLLAAAAEDQPVLCIVDDAQWLDQVSVQTLGFVGRRLLADPVALVFGVRNRPDVLSGLPELGLRGLSDGDARELLDSVVIGRIDERVRDRIIAETRGIPLALLEVPRNVSPAELASGFGNASTPSSAGLLEERYVRRIQSLPKDTQLLLLLAAAEPVGDAALFLRAAAELGIAVDALAPAEADGVIEFGPRMRFHHPLVRSAAYRAADLLDRRKIHHALAEATDPQSDPDRRAWHAAIAATGPDDAVADELDASADRAQSRGGIAAAAAFLERAAVLTADPARRGARALAAAVAKRDAAAPQAAHEMLAIAELGQLSELQRAQVVRLRAQIDFVRSRGGDTGAPRVGDTAPQLLAAAGRLEKLDDYSAPESYLEGISALMYAGRLGTPDALSAAAQAAQAMTLEHAEAPRPVDFLLQGIAERIAGGPPAGAGPLRVALDHMCAQATANDVGRWLVPAFPILQESAAHELWDESVVDRLSASVVRHTRETGALAALPRALVYRAGLHMLAGEFGTATTLIEEADSIGAATDHYAPVRYHRMLLAAWRGMTTDALAIIEAAAAHGVERGEGRLLGLTGYASAVLYNGLGRYEEACAAAHKACEYEDLGFYGWCLLELAEAAAHLSDQQTVASAVEQLERRAGASGTGWGLGVIATARALATDGDDAEDHYRDAVERLEGTRVVVQLARTKLCYGEWLRRGNRRVDARRQLGEAHEMFVTMGAQGFADRARRELVATGEKVRRQPVSNGSELTAQEAQIARLAGDGLTNQEIGAQLFISTHTVEWHLRKVFVKLGISSRRQLRTVSWAS